MARIAALMAMDASAPSYLLNVGTAAEAGVPLEKVQGTLVAIAPWWEVPGWCPRAATSAKPSGSNSAPRTNSTKATWNCL